MLRLASAVVALAALTSLAHAQTATEINTEQQTLATIIPGTCATQCQTWLSTLAGCPGPTDDATYSACVCDATFVSNFDTCAGCIATELATDDAANAATASTAPGDLSGYCSSVGTIVSTTSSDPLSTSTDPLSTETSSTSTDLTSTSTSSVVPVTGISTTSTSRTYTVSIPSITTPSVTVSSSSSVSLASGESPTSTDNIVTLKLTADGQPFPTQSKSSSAFVNAAANARGSSFSMGATLVALAAVAGAMMLA